jgi:hypothetical protein
MNEVLYRQQTMEDFNPSTYTIAVNVLVQVNLNFHYSRGCGKHSDSKYYTAQYVWSNDWRYFNK